MVLQKSRKKISTGTQNLCQSHTIQYIKLKKNGNFKMGNLTLTEILSAWRDLFWIFVVPYKISHLFNNKNTIWLKIYPCFQSQITTCNLPTWPGKPCSRVGKFLKIWGILYFSRGISRKSLKNKKKTSRFELLIARPSYTTKLFAYSYFRIICLGNTCNLLSFISLGVKCHCICT